MDTILCEVLNTFLTFSLKRVINTVIFLSCYVSIWKTLLAYEPINTIYCRTTLHALIIGGRKMAHFGAHLQVCMEMQQWALMLILLCIIQRW